MYYNWVPNMYVSRKLQGLIMVRQLDLQTDIGSLHGSSPWNEGFLDSMWFAMVKMDHGKRNMYCVNIVLVF